MALNKTDRLLAALSTAARRQSDPVKRQKIVDKIKQIKDRKTIADWLGK
jgi:hypothetical protein